MSQQSSMWWYARDDRHQGPFSDTDFKVLAASGQIRPTDLVWKESFADWVTAESVPDLFPSRPTPPPPLKPYRSEMENERGASPRPSAPSIPTSSEQGLSMTTLFRSIMLGCIVLGILGGIADVALVQTLPAPLQQYLASLESAEPNRGDIFLGIIGLIFLICVITSLIGLWKFKPWARTLYVIATILSLLAPLASGPVVMNPWAALFMSLAEPLGGAMLAMMFLPPIAHEFRKNQAPR